MICNKCNHKLPDDSEFCQYCGSRIEQEDVQQADTIEDVQQADTIEEVTDAMASSEEHEEASEMEFPDLENATPEEALEAIIKLQAEQTIKNMEKNRQSQPNYEGDADFGLVPEKPIYTLALKSVDGESEYLDRLCTENGIKIKWERDGSTRAEGVSGMIDIYDTYLPSGEFYKTIYINMYGAKASQGVPKGFAFSKPKVTRPTIHNGMQSPQKKDQKPNKNILDIINIFIILLTVILALIGTYYIGTYYIYYYVPEVFTAIFFIGFVHLLLKILNVVKLKNNIVVTIIIAISLAIMMCCSLAGYVEIGLPICLTTLYLLVCEIYKIIKYFIEKYHCTQSYKLKCYKKVEKIHSYLEKGIMSQEEYEKTKSEILKRVK